MRKLFFTFIVSLISICSFAQTKGDKAVGINLSYATKNSNIGIGVKGQYNITDAIRTEASFDYFLKKDGLTVWDINVNAHYLFPVANKIKIYPLAGLTYTHWNSSFSFEVPKIAGYYGSYGNDEDYDLDSSSSTGKIGVNLGGGASYELTDQLLLNAEIKYQLISDYNQAVFSVGIAYKF